MMASAADGVRTDGIDGTVDQLDELFGVVGWAVDTADPARVLTVELWGGTTLLATTETGLPRPDVADAISADCAPGFRFDADVRDRIREAANSNLSGDLVVRIAGYAQPLECSSGVRTLEFVRLSGAGRAPQNRDALLDRLTLHVDAARNAIVQPMRPLPGRGIGFVESIATDDTGLTWVIGWMTDDVVLDRPIMIVDNGKHPAGLAYTLTSRDDLPPGSKGFVGVLQTDWRASPELLPYFFVTDGSGRFLETLMPTPIKTKTQIAPIVRDLLGRAEGGFRDLLRDLFHTVQSWAVLPDDPSKDLLLADNVAILPGFGAFVSGWALSPTKQALRFVLKARNRIMVADERSVSFNPRPDVAHVYPNAAMAVDRAGFTATFRGDIDSGWLEDLILKVTWDDGSATNVAVRAEQVRVLGITTPIESALGFYPAIEAETFFDDFARHATAGMRARAAAIRVHTARRCAAAVLLAAPTSSSDLFLMFEKAIRHARRLPTDWGIAILARSDGQRSLIIALFNDLVRATGRACSLIFVSDPAAATYAIEQVADALDLERFAFVGPGVMLTRVGWSMIGATDPGLTLLEVVDPLGESAGRADLTAFVTDRARWSDIAAHAPARIGGLRLPPRIDAIPTTVPGAAIALSMQRASPFITRIDSVDGNPRG